MPIISSLVSWLTIKRMTQIELFKQYPIETQNEVLQKLVRSAKDTEFGRKYFFKSINSLKDFKSQVPIQDYEDVKAYVERLKQGQQNLLWPTEIKWFAKSSGTSNDKSKFIPVSKETLEDCHFRGGKDVLGIYTTQFPDTKMFKGKGLVMGGSHKINNFNQQSYYGDLSAVCIQNLPFWAEFLRTPNQAIALMDEWEEKIEKMANATINENVTNIAGVPSWTLVLIKRVLEISGKRSLLDIWPNLELFIHGGVSFTPYRQQFEKIIPSKTMNYIETYNASEGFFAIQDDPAKEDLLLMLDYGIYYEFIPINEDEKECPSIYSLDEVSIGKNYAVLITTNSGLWRYKIGDTVTITSRYPFKIKISGRVKHFMNAFGEEVIIDNAEKALKIACEKTMASFNEYTAAPIYMDINSTGGHQWLFEFENEPQDLNLFAHYLDQALKDFNSDYEAKRHKDLTLCLPTIVALKKGVFYSWLKERGMLGGQHKIPRLSNNRTVVEELLLINSTM